MTSQPVFTFYLLGKELSFKTTSLTSKALATTLPMYAGMNPGKMLTLTFKRGAIYSFPISTPFETSFEPAEKTQEDFSEICDIITEQLNHGLNLYFDDENALVRVPVE